MAERANTDDSATESGRLLLAILVLSVLVIVLGGAVGYILATT